MSESPFKIRVKKRILAGLGSQNPRRAIIKGLQVFMAARKRYPRTHVKVSNAPWHAKRPTHIRRGVLDAKGMARGVGAEAAVCARFMVVSTPWSFQVRESLSSDLHCTSWTDLLVMSSKQSRGSVSCALSVSPSAGP